MKSRASEYSRLSHCRTLGFPLALLLASGCFLDGTPKEISHPTPINIPSPGSPIVAPSGTPQGLTDSSLAMWRKTRDALLHDGSVIASLGRAGRIGPPTPDLFASELDVVLGRDGTIVVLDRGNHSVKVFGPSGNHIRTFGRSGEGPTEFRDASALDRLSDGRLVVTERSNRVKVFSRTRHGEYEYTATHKTGIVADYACSMDGRFFISGWHMESNTVIHEVPLSITSVARSFGPGYEDDYWLIQDQMSNGPIACLKELGLVIFAFQNTPVVRAYSVDTGDLVWSAHLQGYMQPPIWEETRPDGTGRIVFSGKGIRDRVTLLTPVSSQHVLLQTVRYEPITDPAAASVIEDLQVRSHLIDAKTGQGALISASLPLIPVVDPTHQYYAGVWLLPFPRLEIRKVGG